MSNTLAATLLSALLLMPVVQARQDQAPAAPPKSPGPVTMTGCISPKPGTAGQYTFADADGGREYRLSGKGLQKFAGARVELVGGSSGSGLTVRGGLWPAPSGGARGVALDPAQEAIARQQPGGSAAAGPQFPEFRVSKVRRVEGVCE